MGLFSSKTPEQKASDDKAIKTYKKAKAELERVSRRDREETEDYYRANKAVIDAEKNVPWWAR